MLSDGLWPQSDCITCLPLYYYLSSNKCDHINQMIALSVITLSEVLLFQFNDFGKRKWKSILLARFEEPKNPINQTITLSAMQRLS